MVALLPVLTASMPLELATPVATTTAAMGFVSSVAWYGSSLGLFYYGNEVLEVAVSGVEEVIVDVVDQSKV